jgi:hypothetical protein
MNSKDQSIQVIKKGIALLQKEKLYQQIEIIKKLKTLGIAASTSSLSKILNDKPIGEKTISNIELGLKKLITKELGFFFDESESIFKATIANELEIIKPYSPFESKTDRGFRFLPEGRLSIQDKLSFMQEAQHEICELGVRLNTFTNYFINRSANEFAIPFIQLLDKGINIKLYILDPNYNGCLLYFDDRAKIIPSEKKSPERINEILNELKLIAKEYELLNRKGKLELFKYKHVPYNHFLIRDGKKSSAAMIASHYLYGIKRADAPSIRIEKSHFYDLYKRYWKSFQYLINDAMPFDLSS